MSEAGSIVWPSPSEPLWAFDWRLADYPDQEGIVIRSARYRGHQVFYKASLPSLRVQYDGPCGPYKNPLTYNNAQPTSRCPKIVGSASTPMSAVWFVALGWSPTTASAPTA